MIFITVGTHEQPFDRVLKWIDKMVDEKKINEEIVCQKGYTNYEPKNYKAEKLISYEKMQKNIKEARIIISHGGPASFIAALSIGKIPIVVPRKKEFREHINNHQLEFARYVEKKMKNILVVETYDDIVDAITNYENKILELNKNSTSNNKKFNELLMKEIENIM